MELRQYARLLARYRLLIALIALFGALVACVLTLQQPTRYESAAIVAPKLSGAASPDDAYQAQQLAQSSVATYAALATSPVILEAAADDLDGVSAAELLSRLTVEVPEGTTLIDIRATDESATTSRAEAGAVAAALVAEAGAGDGASGQPALPQEAKPATGLRVLQKATFPANPVDDGLGLNVLLGVLLGALLGVALAAVHLATRGRVADRSDLERALPVPVLGTMSLRRRGVPATDTAARDLATVVLGLRDHRHGAITLLDLSRQRDGASLVAALAESISMSGVRVLAVSDAVGTGAELPSLADVAGHGPSVDELASRTRDARRVSIRFGLEDSSSPPMLRSRLHGAITRLQECFDVLLIDAASPLESVNAAAVASLGGGNVLVVEEGKTRRSDVSEAVDILALSDVELHGVVLTTHGLR